MESIGQSEGLGQGCVEPKLAIKKLRNRLSQRAFRARQTLRIKELQRKLDSTSSSNPQESNGLKETNEALKDQLLRSQQMIQSLSLKIQELYQTNAEFLSRLVTHLRIFLKRLETNQSYHEKGKDDVFATSSRPSANASDSKTESLQATHSLQTRLAVAKPTPSIPSPWSQPQISRVDSMGFEAYAKIMNSGPVLLRGPIGCLYRTNSPFSDHLSGVEYSFVNELAKPQALVNHNLDSLTKSVNLMFSMFVNMAWEHGIAFFTFTQAYRAVAPILNYRINPSTDNYLRIVENYRPTRLQISVSYPCIIDWMPWPSMRNRLILYHSTNPDLDQVVVDVGCGFCVQVDLSEYVAGIEPTIGYMRVWDLVTAMAPLKPPKRVISEDGVVDDTVVHALSNDTDVPWVDPLEDMPCDEDTTCELPAPSAEVLFESQNFALRAFKKLIEVGERMLEFKMVPSFFEKYPELFDPTDNYMAYGPRLQPQVPHDPVKSPPTADYQSMQLYIQLTSFILKSISGQSSSMSTHNFSILNGVQIVDSL